MKNESNILSEINSPMPWLSDVEMAKIIEKIPNGFVLVFPMKGKAYFRKKWDHLYMEEI
jgi:hypothetical protein